MSTFMVLPDDHFGVFVENGMDEQRLLWLANAIGEQKLRLAVEKACKKYPESKPFVSKLLKNLRLTVPVAAYAPVTIPVYRVYVLFLADGSKLKVGMTGLWPSRAYSFLQLRQEMGNLFDLDRSTALLVGSDKKQALSLETDVKRRFATRKAPSPWQIVAGEDGIRRESTQIPYGAGGHQEWFWGTAYDDILAFLSTNDGQNFPSFLSLRDALYHDIRAPNDMQDSIMNISGNFS